MSELKNSCLLERIVTLVFICCCSFGQSALAGSITDWGGNPGCGITAPPDGNDFVTIAAGYCERLALKTDGSIVSWGASYPGQKPDSNDFVAIAAGFNHALALKSEGSIVGWGENTDGFGGWYGQATPPDGNDFVAIAAGCLYSLALKSDGSIVVWGRDDYGQVTDTPAGYDFVAIAVGVYHSLALKFDGSIVCWGSNMYGQATPPAGNDFVAIAAGYYHGLALKSDGSIVGWGDNYCGKATPPEGSDFVAIAGGSHHSLALKSDGSIVAWGRDDYGQVTDTPVGNNFVAIAAGSMNSMAIMREPVPCPSESRLILKHPKGGESFYTGRIITISWLSEGNINQVLIKYSLDNKVSWNEVYPANAGNNRRYNWFLPQVNSNQCFIEIFDPYCPIVFDKSDAFTIYKCTLNYDFTGDCFVDMRDFSIFASEWLKCGNPFDADCLP